jgi:hypothetical protein
MWIATKFGFFSVVRNVPRDGTKAPKEEKFIIRSRNVRDLTDFLFEVAPEVTDLKVVQTPDNDYAARLFCSQDHLSRFLQYMVLTLDYDNFKSMIHGSASQSDKSQAYMECWDAMRNYQASLSPKKRHKSG